MNRWVVHVKNSKIEDASEVVRKATKNEKK